MNKINPYDKNPVWFVFRSVLTHETGEDKPDHKENRFRSYKAKYDSMKGKYMPHQGKKECERRMKRANSN